MAGLKSVKDCPRRITFLAGHRIRAWALLHIISAP